jgi:hypothetical protein
MTGEPGICMNYKRILVYVIVHLSFIRELGRSFFFVAKVFSICIQ